MTDFIDSHAPLDFDVERADDRPKPAPFVWEPRPWWVRLWERIVGGESV